MWLLGLVLGAIAGATLGGIVDAIGSGAGTVLGAIAGTVGGWLLSQQARAAQDARLRALETALRALQSRITALEARQAAPAAPPHDAADTLAPQTRPAPSAALVAVDANAPPAAVIDDGGARRSGARAAESAAAPVQGPPVFAKEPAAAGPQILGVVIGAVLGLTAGFEGMALGALLGGLVGWAIASQNRRAAHETSGMPPAAVAQPATTSVAHTSADVAPATAGAAAAQASAEPPTPAPGLHTTWMQRLLGGNIVAKVGVLILFCGVGFLLKYAYDQGRLPVQVRLAAVALIGFAMLYVGRRLLAQRRLYGLILQGGGIGLLYLDVFFALRLYGLIGAAPGFAAFMVLGIAATLLAVRQDAKVLAVLGLTGAFLAPILASTGGTDHVLLFSYYTLLNAGVLAVSWFKAWRDLNLVGFLFTFVVGLLWGSNHYQPELFATVEPFVLILFAMYLVIPILFAQRQPPELKGLVDGTLVFGTPLCAAFMQAGLVRDMPNGLAWSAGIAGALYAVLALMTLRRAGMRVLGESYVALAVVFFTLAVFFAFDAYPTFALWTLEGAAIVWVGLRQRRLLARFFGLGLQLAGAVYFLARYESYDFANPWWNGFVLGCALIAVSGFIIAWLLHRYREVRHAFEPGDTLMLVWAGCWWTVGGVHALDQAYAWQGFATGFLAFSALSVLAAELIGARLRWPALRGAANVLLPVMVFALLLQATRGSHPFAHYGWLVWPGAIAATYFMLWRQEREDAAVTLRVRHLGALWLTLGVLSWEAAWQLDSIGFGRPWSMAVAGVIPALAVAWISSPARTRWPFEAHYTSLYRDRGLRVVVICLALWLFYANVSTPGEMRPVRYLPLLNPLDVASLAVFAAVWRWWRTIDSDVAQRNRIAVALYGALVFLWLNSVLLRTIHYWTGVDYAWHALARSMLAQSGFSLLWTATAFVLMRYATRVQRRPLWVVGAVLLGAVVLKLFVNDLGNIGTVARIVSFIGVGAGLLLIGYVAPVPPGDVERQAD